MGFDGGRVEAVGRRRGVVLCTRSFRRWVEVVRPDGRWGRSVARHRQGGSMYRQERALMVKVGVRRSVND